MNKLEALNKRRQEIEKQIKIEEEKQAIMLGKLAIKAGLSELNLNNKQLLEVMKEVAMRFQNKEEKQI